MHKPQHRTAAVHCRSDELRSIVRELERLAIEAGRALASASSLSAAARAVRPRPSDLECAESLQDTWCGTAHPRHCVATGSVNAPLACSPGTPACAYACCSLAGQCAGMSYCSRSRQQA